MGQEICPESREECKLVRPIIQGINIAMYGSFYLYLIWVTISTYRTYKSSRTDKYSILLHICAHCTCLTTLTYLVLMFSNYPLDWFLRIVDEMPVCFYNLGLLVSLCTIQNTLYRVVQSSFYRRLERLMWVLAILHVGTLVALLVIKLGPVKGAQPAEYYLLCGNIFFFLLFAALTVNLYMKYRRTFSTFTTVKTSWMYCIIAMLVLLVVRILASILNVKGLTNDWSQNKALIANFYHIVLNLMCEILPFLILIMFSQLQSHESLLKLLESPNDSTLIPPIGANLKASFFNEPEAGNMINP